MHLIRYLACALAVVATPVLAAVDRYTIDPDHTFPTLEFSHMGVSTWRGRFNKTGGKVTLDRAARRGNVEIVVDTSTIDFGHRAMREFALAEDWLNVAKHPAMTYKGEMRFDGDTPASVDGELTLRGVTKPLKLRINSFKCIAHPMFKKEVCGADVEGDLDRADFGMTLYSDGGAGKVHLRIQVEALKDEWAFPFTPGKVVPDTTF